VQVKKACSMAALLVTGPISILFLCFFERKEQRIQRNYVQVKKPCSMAALLVTGSISNLFLCFFERKEQQTQRTTGK